MSNYEPIVPVTNPFNFHGALIEPDIDAGGGVQYGSFFVEGSWSYTKKASDSHFIGIKSDKLLIIDRCDFTVIQHTSDPAKLFTIESSIDDKYWKTLYTGTVPKTNDYDWLPYNCEFNPTRCKYIRCTFNSVAHEIYTFGGKSFKFYGALSTKQDPFLYTNPDAYGILKKDDDK